MKTIKKIKIKIHILFVICLFCCATGYCQYGSDPLSPYQKNLRRNFTATNDYIFELEVKAWVDNSRWYIETLCFNTDRERKNAAVDLRKASLMVTEKNPPTPTRNLNYGNSSNSTSTGSGLQDAAYNFGYALGQRIAERIMGNKKPQYNENNSSNNYNQSTNNVNQPPKVVLPKGPLYQDRIFTNKAQKETKNEVAVVTGRTSADFGKELDQYLKKSENKVESSAVRNELVAGNDFGFGSPDENFAQDKEVFNKLGAEYQAKLSRIAIAEKRKERAALTANLDNYLKNDFRKKLTGAKNAGEIKNLKEEVANQYDDGIKAGEDLINEQKKLLANETITPKDRTEIQKSIAELTSQIEKEKKEKEETIKMIDSKEIELGD